MIAHLAALTLLTTGSPAMGEEEFGNKPKPEQPDWAGGVVTLANDTHRVYRRWVNGNEEFFFQGDSAAVNVALEQFARVAAPVREVVLMPAAGRTESFEGKRVDYGWRLYAPSGLVLGPEKTGMPPVFPGHATITIHVAGTIELAGLSVPEGVTLVAPDQLLDRYRLAERHDPDYARTVAQGARAGLEAEIQPDDAVQREHLEAVRDFVRECRDVDVEIEWDDKQQTFQARIVNRRRTPITVLRTGDASSAGWRTPLIRWEVYDAASGELVKPRGFIGCGNMDPLRPGDIVELAPGASTDLGRWLGKPHFPADGAYRVRLVYENVPSFPNVECTTDDASLVEAVRASTPLHLTSAAQLVTVRR
ncbi:MAG: hypothetical protein GY711_26145 [bacterium]|nr:hypothetical protein [bacterium]